jgi:hypothetical protein
MSKTASFPALCARKVCTEVAALSKSGIVAVDLAKGAGLAPSKKSFVICRLS